MTREGVAATTSGWPADESIPPEAWKKAADLIDRAYDGPPITFRSMGWLERRLRGLAGSGWNGEHPTGYRWAQRLVALGERWWLRGIA